MMGVVIPSDLLEGANKESRGVQNEKTDYPRPVS